MKTLSANQRLRQSKSTVNKALNSALKDERLKLRLVANATYISKEADRLLRKTNSINKLFKAKKGELVADYSLVVDGFNNLLKPYHQNYDLVLTEIKEDKINDNLEGERLADMTTLCEQEAQMTIDFINRIYESLLALKQIEPIVEAKTKTKSKAKTKTVAESVVN